MNFLCTNDIISIVTEKTQKGIPNSQSRKLHIEVVRQILTLATSGFGLVAALAWNSVVQEFVNSYVKQWIPHSGGIISLLIYAILITTLAVFVTVQLSRFLRTLEDLEDRDFAPSELKSIIVNLNKLIRRNQEDKMQKPTLLQEEKEQSFKDS